MPWWKVLFFVLLIVTLLFDVKILYIVAYVAFFMYFILGKLVKWSLDSLIVERSSKPVLLFPGEKGQVSLQLQNTTFMPIFWLSGHDRAPNSLVGTKANRWVTNILPTDKNESSYPITGRKRGIFAVGPVHLTAGDPLGIHSFFRTVELEQEVCVYPHLYPLRSLGLPSRLPFGNLKANRKIFPDPARLGGVRPYQQRDPLKSIHWKATARMNTLQVKQFEHTVSVDTLILLNLNEEDYDVSTIFARSELAIETAASLSAYLSTLGEGFGIVSNGALARQVSDQNAVDSTSEITGVLRVQPRRGTDQLANVMWFLAGVVCSQAVDFASVVAEEAKGYSWGATLMLVTPVDSENLVAVALSLVKSGFQVMIFVTGQKVMHPSLLQRPADASLQVFLVSKSTELHLQKHA